MSEEEARIFEEQMYWEDYHYRNSEPAPRKKRAAGAPSPAVKAVPAPLGNSIEATDEQWERELGSEIFISDVTDDDVPF